MGIITEKKHQDINTYFDSLAAKNEKFHDGKEEVFVKTYSYKYCLYKTAQKFYLNWKTVENIINGWGSPVVKVIDPRQTSIPLD